MSSSPSSFRRVVTTHTGAQSTVLLNDTLTPVPGFAADAVTVWKTDRYPAELASRDPAADASSIRMYTRGSLLRIVDFPPSSYGHNHRTQTVDYAAILDGEMQLELDDGTTVLLEKGDVLVQQATMHRWNNLSDRVARVLFVLLPSEAFVFGDRLGDEGIPEQFRVRQ